MRPAVCGQYVLSNPQSLPPGLYYFARHSKLYGRACWNWTNLGGFKARRITIMLTPYIVPTLLVPPSSAGRDRTLRRQARAPRALQTCAKAYVAQDRGFEPPRTVLETVMLPLHQSHIHWQTLPGLPAGMKGGIDGKVHCNTFSSLWSPQRIISCGQNTVGVKSFCPA